MTLLDELDRLAAAATEPHVHISEDSINAALAKGKP